LDLQLALTEAVRHHQAGQLPEAEAKYRSILREQADNADALHLLGVLQTQRGDTADGIALIRRALQIRPDAPAFHNNLGKALADEDDRGAAIACYRRAIELAPGYAEAHYNLGVTLEADGDHVAAEDAYRRAIALAPRHFKAKMNLATVLMGQGRARDAMTVLLEARELEPKDPKTYRALSTAALYDPAVDEVKRRDIAVEIENRLVRSLNIPRMPHANLRDPERRLRIGWVSSDFRGHPVARNLEPILVNLDRSRLETFCYAEVDRPDATTERFKGMADGWRWIVGRSDEEVARLVRADGIDILVVLAARFDHNRPLIAAHRPAPVQVSLFDGGTSGLSGMDYIFADPVVIPRGTREYFSERALRLPSLYVYPLPAAEPAVGPPPSLATGQVTFGCFNNPIKVNDETLALWAAVLCAMPQARLHLKYRNRFWPLRGHIERVFAAESVAANRLELGSNFVEHAAHMALYNAIDVALDPFPFTGSTTTFEALWMGVPVVTLAGENMSSRWSASILHALKLDDLVARSPSEYVAKAVALASDSQRLTELRQTLRDCVAASPLCNGPRRARQMERFFRAVWQRWCRAP
jgi:protein O-GlcNAc transferase